MGKTRIAIGRWGRLHEEYLMDSYPDKINKLDEEGELESYLTDVDKRAQKMMESLIEDLCQKEGVDINDYDPLNDIVSEGISILAEENVLNAIVYNSAVIVIVKFGKKRLARYRRME